MQNMIDLSSDNALFQSYLVKPEGQAKGGLIVIHEVWGLNDHIKSVADRFAKEGYIVLAPDLLGDTEIAAHADQLQLDIFDPAKRSQAQPKMRALMAPIQEPEFGKKTVSKLMSCFDYLYNLASTNQKVAVSGFCFGGSYSYSLAVSESRLKAAIPFYGHAPEDQAAIDKIACPILAFYGAQDEGLIKDLDAVKAMMSSAGVNYRAVVYPDCGHAFFNDTNKFTYNQAAAADAWQQTITFLEQQMSN